MKKIITLLCIAFQALVTHAQNGNHQPNANYWFPSTILTWTPASDTSSAFNKGHVPLAGRFIDTLSSPCPVSKNPNVKLTCLTVTNANTSNNPSQGYDHAGEYAFGFWQYVNYFVMWGGSAGEGIILAPNATWIDAGHRNGVKVMGTIFMPPNVYGGQLQWLNDLTQSSGGVYPVADKLIEVANYYGFDGWFINEETSGGNSGTGAAMQGFMSYFQQHKSGNMEIMWYDAMLPSGAISYQNALNNNNVSMFQNGATLESNTMFLNFNWSSTGLTNSAAQATTVGRSPYDLFAGIDVQANGYNTGVNWTSIFSTVRTPKVGVGLYVPSWTFHSSPDKNDIPLFYQREEKFWVGGNNSPCSVPGSGWPGLSKYYIEKSVVNSWPFITSFNTGHGTSGFWVDGNKLSVKQWHNQSIQDILPTWRWVTQTAGTPLTIDWDFTDAYNGGNSLKISGSLGSSNTNEVRLYNTQLPVSAASSLSITYKLGSVAASNMQVVVAFTDAPATYYYLNCGSTTTTGWQTSIFSLAPYAGKTVCVIGLQFASTSTISNYAMNIGEIALTNGTASTPAAPSNLTLTTYTDCENAELKVLFDTSVSNNIWYYDIYRIKPDGVKQWIGRTSGNAYYIKNIKRIDNEASTQIAVVAVNTSKMSSPAVLQTLTWPANATGYAASLNGTSKYLASGIVNLSGSAVTLEGWVNANSFKTASPNISALMGIDDTAQNLATLGIGNATIGNNKVQFSLNVGGTTQTLTSATALSPNTWYHVAGTYDGSNMTIYINGAHDVSVAASGAVKANGHFFIGRDSMASATGYLDGSVDEMRAWTVARSASDIAASKCSVSDTTAGLAAYWPFNDCSNGLIAYDNSGYGHDGIAKNMTAADWVADTVCKTISSLENVFLATGSFSLYPNPASQDAGVILELPVAMASEFYIYDETGKLLQHNNTEQKLTNINTQSIEAGVYFCRVLCAGYSYTVRFIILK